MDNLYMLTDATILARIGEHLKQDRLRQNITQQSLAETAKLSLSTLKKIEKGEIRTMDSLLRVLRTLGRLDILLPLVEEEPLSPSAYYELVHSVKAKVRKRAVGKLPGKGKEASEW